MVYLSVWSGQSIQTSTPSTAHPLQTPSDPLPPSSHPEEDLDCVPNKTARRNYRAEVRVPGDSRQAGHTADARLPCMSLLDDCTLHCEIDNEYPPTELVGWSWSTERGERRGKQGNASGDVFSTSHKSVIDPGAGGCGWG